MNELLQNFNFNRDFYEAAKVLERQDAERLVWAMLAYVYDGMQPDLDGTLKAVFLMAKGRLDAAVENAQKNARRSKTSGVITPDKTAVHEGVITPDKTAEKLPQKEKEKEYKKEVLPNGSTKKETRARFKPPTVQEVEAYARAKPLPNTFNAQKFCDYYTANGWKVGRNPMKDWQAAARNWAARDGTTQKTKLVCSVPDEWSVYDD